MRRETDSWQLAPKWQLWLIVAGISQCAGSDRHKAIGTVHDFKTTTSGGFQSSTKRKLSQLSFTLLISKPLVPKVPEPSPWLEAREKASGPLSRCAQVQKEAGLGTHEEGACLPGQHCQSSLPPCSRRCQGHVPTVHLAASPLRRGRHGWESKDLLKASSYCKLAPRSLQSKKLLWFCIWHIYAPFLLGTSLKVSEWIATFKKKSVQKYRST